MKSLCYIYFAMDRLKIILKIDNFTNGREERPAEVQYRLYFRNIKYAISDSINITRRCDYFPYEYRMVPGFFRFNDAAL